MIVECGMEGKEVKMGGGERRTEEEARYQALRLFVRAERSKYMRMALVVFTFA